MGRHEYPRAVKTVLPEDGVFSFTAKLCAEGCKGGLRFTVPAPVARGMRHLNVGIGSHVSVVFNVVNTDGDRSFTGIVRAPNARQMVISLPLEARRGLRGRMMLNVRMKIPSGAR